MADPSAPLAFGDLYDPDDPDDLYDWKDRCDACLGAVSRDFCDELLWRASRFADPEARHRLGTAFLDGVMGMSIDLDEAVRWLGLSAAQDHVPSLISLGWLHYRGVGAERVQGFRADKEKGFRLLHRAAVLGDATSQYAVAKAYGCGDGVLVDTREGINWMLKAADNGYGQAQLEAGWFFRKGVPGVIFRDPEEAFGWWTRAGEGGQVDAQVLLAKACDAGEGLPLNKAEAAAWWRLAAENGHAEAMYRLGIALIDGLHVPQNMPEAVKWLRFAAATGHVLAEELLSEILPLSSVPSRFVPVVRGDWKH